VILLIALFAIASTFASEGKFVRTPHGLAWNSCVHKIPNGAHVFTDEDGVTSMKHPETGRITTYPPCQKQSVPEQKRDSPDDGWQIWTAYNNENNETFTSFLGYFSVPKDPSNWDGGILYMFTGLQNDNWIPYPSNGTAPPNFDIIQPVLQYGTTPAGGGSYWAIASWYVTVDSNYFVSDLLQLNAGDVIFGNMTKVGDSSWFISGYSQELKNATYITATEPRLYAQSWAYTTLEVYEIDDCEDDFPAGPMKFTKMALYGEDGESVTPKWEAFNNGVDHCGASAVINSAESVTFNFNT